EGMFVLVVQVQDDVEDHLLDRTNEDKQHLIFITSIDHQTIVSTHVQTNVAAEAERHSVIQPPTPDPFAVDEQRDLTKNSRLRLVHREGQLNIHISHRQLHLKLLVILEHPQERV